MRGPRIEHPSVEHRGVRYPAVKLDTRRLWVVGAATAFVLLGVTAVLWALVMRGWTTAAGDVSSLPSQGPAPDFELTNHLGEQVHLSALQGRVVLMNFFYAECPGFCSLMNFNLRQVYDALEDHVRAKVVLLSISFNCLADTPEKLAKYARERGFAAPNWHFLTGSCDEIDRVTQAYGIPVRQTEPQVHIHPEGTPHVHEQDFGHLAQALLIDQKGEVRKAYLGVPGGKEIFAPPLIVDDIYALLGRR